MKIVNICLTGPYNEGWGYQENLLSKYQSINGNEVTVITSRFVTIKNSNKSFNIVNQEEYVNEDNVKVIRLDFYLSKMFSFVFRKYQKLEATLENENPDLIFIHGLQSLAVYDIISYKKKHPQVRLIVDNHADYTNTALNLPYKLFNKLFWKQSAKALSPYVDKFYGVLPIRCDFLTEMYGVDKNKIELLVMGADDHKVELGQNNRDKIIKKYQMKESDFTILTGGKIDKYKKETLELMKVVNDLEENIKLIVFGSVEAELKDEFNKLLSPKILYLNWLNQQDIYDLLTTVDLAIYPGRHSVLWEQSVGSGCPCVFRYLNKSQHVNVHDNCLFLKRADYSEMKEVIERLYNDTDFYNKLKNNTKEYGMKEFSYQEIAKKSIS